MADESLKFFMEYFVDPVYGEVYADRSREGGRVSYSGGFWDENKGSMGKAAYHSIETAYYSYLYAKLVLQRDTARLYYHFKPVNFERQIRMNPVQSILKNFGWPMCKTMAKAGHNLILTCAYFHCLPESEVYLKLPIKWMACPTLSRKQQQKILLMIYVFTPIRLMKKSAFHSPSTGLKV